MRGLAYILNRFFGWLFLLFSDSKFASTRRLIGVLAFAVLVALCYCSVTHKIENLGLTQKLTDYMFYIVCFIVVGASAVDIVKLVRLPNVFGKEETVEENENK